MKRILRRATGSQGFTLIEILVAVALSGIILTVGAPSATKLLQRYQLRGATSQLSFELVRARTQAISQNRSVRFTLHRSGGYTVERSNDNGTFGSVVAQVDLPSGIELSADFDAVTFDRDGSADRTVVISLANNEAHRTISMNSIGRMTES